MLSVDQAIESILRHAQPLPARSTPLPWALGWTLAEDVHADIDLPPFDKALMDGYAVRSVDLSEPGEHRLRVVEEITAGRMPSRSISEGEAARIMTGAPLPLGADAVVMVEHSRSEGPTVILRGPAAPGQNRLTRGREMKAGEVLLTRGTRLDPTRIGLIASAGRAEILAIPSPTVAVVPTGDELVPSSAIPGPGQIRNTNGVMLAGLVQAWGARQVHESPVAPDDPGSFRKARVRNSDECPIGSTARRVDPRPDRRAHRQRRCLGRDEGPRSGNSDRPGGRADLPQGECQAGQAALVRGRTETRR